MLAQTGGPAVAHVAGGQATALADGVLERRALQERGGHRRAEHVPATGRVPFLAAAMGREALGGRRGDPRGADRPYAPARFGVRPPLKAHGPSKTQRTPRPGAPSAQPPPRPAL